MSALDDKINSLSSDELDLLNSDPNLLNEFKTKYKQPQAPKESSMLDVAKEAVRTALPSPAAFDPLKPVSDNPVMGGLESAIQTLRDPTRISPTISQPGQIAGQKIEDFAEKKDFNPLVGKAAGFITSMALDPQTYLFGGKATGPESVTKSFAEELADNADSKLASLNKKLANIPENATKLGGFNEAVPTQSELDQATQNLIKAKTQVFNEHGALLNEAKTNAGLPASKDEMDASIRKFGNQYGLDINKPLQLAEDAPKEGLFKPGDTVPVKSPKEGLPDMMLTYKGPSIADSPEALKEMGMTDAQIKSMKQPLYDISNDLPGHPAKSSLGEEELRKLGYDLPSVEGRKPMPYTIGAHDTPQELNSEINRFKENLQFISKPDRIKAASYLQDQIHDQGVFKGDIAKGPVMGRLKGQYGDLAQVIQDASPDLQSAKTKFASLKNSLDLTESKIDPDRPGATQAYLKRLFLSASPSSQDQLKELAHLEQLTGRPVVTNLFKKFAGQSFGDLVSRPTPKVLGLTEKIAPKLAAPATYLTYKGFQTPEMQSLRDRLNNETKFKDSKYAK